MKDWTIRRLEINRKIRSILVRHRIDLGKITVHVYPRRVMVRGRLVRLGGVSPEMEAATVTSLFDDLERLRDIRLVQHDLSNWRRTGDALEWVSLDQSMAPPA